MREIPLSIKIQYSLNSNVNIARKASHDMESSDLYLMLIMKLL